MYRLRIRNASQVVRIAIHGEPYKVGSAMNEVRVISFFNYSNEIHLKECGWNVR
jgi:hypothetical protein